MCAADRVAASEAVRQRRARAPVPAARSIAGWLRGGRPRPWGHARTSAGVEDARRGIGRCHALRGHWKTSLASFPAGAGLTSPPYRGRPRPAPARDGSCPSSSGRTRATVVIPGRIAMDVRAAGGATLASIEPPVPGAIQMSWACTPATMRSSITSMTVARSGSVASTRWAGTGHGHWSAFPRMAAIVRVMRAMAPAARMPVRLLRAAHAGGCQENALARHDGDVTYASRRDHPAAHATGEVCSVSPARVAVPPGVHITPSARLPPARTPAG